MRELVQGAHGLDVLLEEGGAVQGLPITGVLEWTAVRRDESHFETAVLNACMTVACIRCTHLQSPTGQKGCYWWAVQSSKGQ